MEDGTQVVSDRVVVTRVVKNVEWNWVHARFP